MRVLIGVSGASGSSLALRTLSALLTRGHTVYAVLSEAGRLVLRHEQGLSLPDSPESARAVLLAALACPGESDLTLYGEREMDAPVASGSFPLDAMAIVPCSMGCLSAIAHGASGNLLERAADVQLKEGRKLVLVARETPLSAIHLQNMLTLAQCGAVIMPPMPAFYAKLTTMDDMADAFVGRLLARLGVENDLYPRWGD